MVHYSRCTAAALRAAKYFPVEVVVVYARVERVLFGLCAVVRQAVADLMLVASDVMDYLGNSRQRRNTSGSY